MHVAGMALEAVRNDRRTDYRAVFGEEEAELEAGGVGVAASEAAVLRRVRKGGEVLHPAVQHSGTAAARRRYNGRVGRFAKLFFPGVILITWVAWALAGCRSEPRLTAQQLEGKHLYAVRCAHCHEDNDLALKKVPPDLHRVFKGGTLAGGAPATDAEVERIVLSGKGMMPSFAGRFDQDEMAALIAYLHTGLR